MDGYGISVDFDGQQLVVQPKNALAKVALGRNRLVVTSADLVSVSMTKAACSGMAVWISSFGTNVLVSCTSRVGNRRISSSCIVGCVHSVRETQPPPKSPRGSRSSSLAPHQLNVRQESRSCCGVLAGSAKRWLASRTTSRRCAAWLAQRSPVNGK